MLTAADDKVPVHTSVDGQPLGANILRVVQALDYLGTPLSADAATALKKAARERDAVLLQKLLDPHVLFVVSLNPEVRVKVTRGPAKATLQQRGFTPLLVKILNDSHSYTSVEIDQPAGWRGLLRSQPGDT